MATITSTIKLVDQMSPTLKKISKAIDRVDQKSRKLGDNLDGFTNGARRAATAFNKLEQEVKGVGGKAATLATKFGNVANKLRSLGNSSAWGKMRSGANQTANAVNRLYNGLRRAFYIFTALRSLSGLAHVADDMMNATSRVNLINDGLATTPEYLDKMYAAAQRSRGGFNDMISSVGKLGVVAGDAFDGSVDQMIAFNELMNKLYRISGSSHTEAAAASYQLTQALASGRLQGEELRSILEQAPLLAQYLAEELGVTRGELRELAAEGKLTADVITNALFGSAREINEAFDKLPKTLGDIWNQIKNSAINAFRPVIDRIQSFINSPFFDACLTRLEALLQRVANSVIWLFDQFERPEVQAILGALQNVLMALWTMIEQIGAAIGRVYNYLIDNNALVVECINIITEALNWLWNAFLWVGNIAVSVAKWICDNWSWIGDIVYVVIAALVAYKAYQLACSAAAVVAWIAEGVAAWVAGLMAGSAWAWVILIIGALIAIIYLAVAAWNYFTGQSVSAFGVLLGCIAWLIAAIWDVIYIIFALTVTVVMFVGSVIDTILRGIDWILTFLIACLHAAVVFCTVGGQAIVDTFSWIIDCAGIFLQNCLAWIDNLFSAISAWLGAVGHNILVFFKTLGPGISSTFWNCVVNAGEAFNAMLRGASDIARKMVKPFENFANAVVDILNSLIRKWNSWCSSLTFTIPGLKIMGKEIWGEQKISVLGKGVNELDHVSWSDWSDPEGIDLGGAYAKANAAAGKLADIQSQYVSLGNAWNSGWNTNGYADYPEYTVNWSDAKDSAKEAFGMHDLSGDRFTEIWSKFGNVAKALWEDGGLLVNPNEQYSKWYEKGEAFDNKVGKFAELLGGIFGAIGGLTKNDGASDKLKEALGLGAGGLIDKAGQSVADKIGGLLPNDQMGDLLSGWSPSDALGEIADNTGNSAGSAGNIEDTLNLAEEELELLRKLAEQEVINRFTTAEIHVDMTNNNNISSKMDLDGIVTHLSNKLYEELGVVASGVHY